MPAGHVTSPWEASLFAMAEERKKWVGFDGSFSLPTEQRILLEAAQAGEYRILMKVIQHLGLDKREARDMFFRIMSEPGPQSVEVAERFVQALPRG